MTRWIPGFILVVSLPARAAGPPLNQFCEPLRCDGCEVRWKAPTNLLPGSVRIFHVVPSKFSASTISNLLHLAELSEMDKKRPVQTGVFLGKGVRSYESKDETRNLDVVPSEGYIVLVNSGAVAGAREPSHGVPSATEATKLLVNLLPRLGIEKSEVATNRAGRIAPRSLADETELHKEKFSGTIITNLLSRWIALNRHIDGIPVWGDAGVRAKFGSQGRLAELTATWRAIEPSKRCPVPSSNEFVNRIKTGKALVRDGENGSFTRLTITNASLYYWENSGSEPQGLVHAFAVLEADTGRQGKDRKLEIFVPFTSD